MTGPKYWRGVARILDLTVDLGQVDRLIEADLDSWRTVADFRPSKRFVERPLARFIAGEQNLPLYSEWRSRTTETSARPTPERC
jgi:hypothetical protein